MQLLASERHIHWTGPTGFRAQVNDTSIALGFAGPVSELLRKEHGLNGNLWIEPTASA
jgi:hypothetical protein